MNTGTTEEIQKALDDPYQFIYRYHNDQIVSWLRSLLEERDKQKELEHTLCLTVEAADKTIQQLREELERTRASAKHWQDRYDRDADRLPIAMVEAESLRSELAAKDKVLKDISTNSLCSWAKDNANGILSQYEINESNPDTATTSLG